MMNSKFFSIEVILDTLNRHELGDALPHICDDLGIGEITFSRWKSEYGDQVSLKSKVVQWYREHQRKEVPWQAILRELEWQSVDELDA